MERNQARLPTSTPIFDLNEVKRGAMLVRSASMRSRNRESTSLPPPRTPSTTDATSRSHGVSAIDESPGLSSRSVICSLRSPPQTLRSVVVGFDT